MGKIIPMFNTPPPKEAAAAKPARRKASPPPERVKYLVIFHYLPSRACHDWQTLATCEDDARAQFESAFAAEMKRIIVRGAVPHVPQGYVTTNIKSIQDLL